MIGAAGFGQAPNTGVGSGLSQKSLTMPATLSGRCANGVDYLLIGGYALAAHGYQRATIDIDLMVASTVDAGVMAACVGRNRCTSRSQSSNRHMRNSTQRATAFFSTHLQARLRACLESR